MNFFKGQQNITKFRNLLVRNYAFKSDLKIKWVRPEHIPCYKPEKSGDLKPLPEIDCTQLQRDFRDCKELQDADKEVQKLFSLEFASRWKVTQIHVKNAIDSVQRHSLDTGSIEAKIAKWTVVIRTLQNVMDNFPRNKRLQVKLKELIEKRKKHLKYLRRWDYKRFEWLLENLNIVYKPNPTEYSVTRKDSLRKLTQKYCDDIKNQRLTAYKQLLQAEQPAFLEEKIKTLEFIRKEQMDCGVSVTVTEEEIDSVKKELQTLLKSSTTSEN